MVYKLSVLGRPINLDNSRTRACTCSRCGSELYGHVFSHLSARSCMVIFSLICLFSFLSLGDGSI